MGRALLPAYGHAVPPHHLEHVAYLGAIGVALAVLGLACDFRRRRTKPERDRAARNAVYLLVLVGLFFAFGLYNPLYVLLARYVPGFAHFRVPARWLALYGIGTAAMAGHAIQTLWESKAPGGRDLLTVAAALAVLILWAVIGSLLGGMDELYLLSVVGWVGASLSAMGLLLAASRISRAATVGLLALLTVELFLASRALPQTRATAPQAFTSLRPAVAHLLASISPAGAPPSRFLSMSDTTFDPGDLSLIRTIYEPQLSNDELYDYIVASKQKEVMSPNLPLAFGVPAVDGYDGGVLPLQRYVALERAFLSGQEVSMDGRLRENLKAIPQGRWLNLFNVRYVITDKLRDAWIDDVFYDLQFGARLSGGESATVGDVPRFEATALGVVSHLEGGAALPQGAPVGIATLRFADGDTAAFTLLAGEDVREAAVEQVSRETATARLSWPEPRTPVTVNVEAIEPGVTWVVRGLSLIDERTGSFQSLVVSGEGHFRMIHSGDVKIYENVDALPRAFTVAHARVASDAEEAREAMMDPMVDLSSEVVLERGGSCKGPTADSADLAEPSSGELPVSGSARIVSYQPERVVVRAGLDRPGYLVLTDAFYPGWQATVDGERASICQADLLFRALPLEPGNHRVVFRFRPPLQRVGAAISGLGLLLLLAAWHERRIVETVVRCYNRMQT
ncbi:MAG: YfhO family protein, partial [Anaerolineae bacterium]